MNARLGEVKADFFLGFSLRCLDRVFPLIVLVLPLAARKGYLSTPGITGVDTTAHKEQLKRLLFGLPPTKHSGHARSLLRIVRSITRSACVCTRFGYRLLEMLTAVGASLWDSRFRRSSGITRCTCEDDSRDVLMFADADKRTSFCVERESELH